MAWFSKIRAFTKNRIDNKVKIPEGLWIKCDKCKEILYAAEFAKEFRVCSKCNNHHRISAKERISLLIDEGTLKEYDKDIYSADPLKFRDSKRYKDRLKQGYKKTGLKDAIICGKGLMNGRVVNIAVLEFNFMGGSMGVVVGEKITRVIERSIEKGIPLIIVSCSGGARMQEGILSLMEMAKTSAALSKLDKKKVPFISVLTDPTYGGVSASFAMLGDIIISEPGAMIGFAGPRVIEQTIKQTLPEGFQTAEFLLQNGTIDMVVKRKDMKQTIVNLLDHIYPPSPSIKV